MRSPSLRRASCTAQWKAASGSVSSYTLLESYPHDPAAFTQGLVYAPEAFAVADSATDAFFESTGLVHHSSLRCVDRCSGVVLRAVSVPPPHFAEGLAYLPLPRHRLVQLTWLSGCGFVYDASTLQRLHHFECDYEGWGATYDAHRDCLYVSDGTDCVRVLDPDTCAVRQAQRVRLPPHLREVYRERGVPPAIWHLNDLEWVPGADELWCNVFLSDFVLVVDPATWCAKRWIDLRGLLQPEHQLPNHPVDVLNGLAWDRQRHCMYATGKCWPRLYAIRETECRGGM